MLKTISAALLAASVIAAPALAAGYGKTTQAPVSKTAQVEPNGKVNAKAQVKPSALNANAKMDKHHVKHAKPHKKMEKTGALKTHQASKATIKHAAAASKRG